MTPVHVPSISLYTPQNVLLKFSNVQNPPKKFALPTEPSCNQTPKDYYLQLMSSSCNALWNIPIPLNERRKTRLSFLCRLLLVKFQRQECGGEIFQIFNGETERTCTILFHGHADPTWIGTAKHRNCSLTFVLFQPGVRWLNKQTPISHKLSLLLRM